MTPRWHSPLPAHPPPEREDSCRSGQQAGGARRPARGTRGEGGHLAVRAHVVENGVCRELHLDGHDVSTPRARSPAGTPPSTSPAGTPPCPTARGCNLAWLHLMWEHQRRRVGVRLVLFRGRRFARRARLRRFVLCRLRGVKVPGRAVEQDRETNFVWLRTGSTSGSMNHFTPQARALSLCFTSNRLSLEGSDRVK